jgi:hypothetical protein
MAFDEYGYWYDPSPEQLRAEKRKKWFIASAVVGIPLLLLLIPRLLIRLRMRGEITDLERKVRKIKLEKELRDLKDKEEGS